MTAQPGERPCGLNAWLRQGTGRFEHPATRREPGAVLVIDAANVIGSRPTGWWRDRAGAASRFVEQVRVAARAGRLSLPAVIVLEGAGRGGAAESDADGVRVVHAAHSGDDAVVAQVPPGGAGAIVVTADRLLCERVRALGAETVGPTWLTGRLGD